MLMVVFGAGASFDSAPTYPPHTSPPYFAGMESRLPLADQLFDNRDNFVFALNQFPRCHPIIPYLRNRKAGVTIERVLQGLQDEAADYPERYKQLAAVRYYLQYMLYGCEFQWSAEATQGITNQITLLDQIERWRKADEQVCLVTFNYDTMLERALGTVGVPINDLSDYVAGNKYKLIKLHGSVNWGRRVVTPVQFLNRNRDYLINALIDGADTLKITQNYNLVDQRPIHMDSGSVLFPALAIPVESKLDFECPEEHLQALRAVIPQVTKLLVIGWRAAETPFLDLLAQNLSGPIEGLIVSGNEDAAKETENRLAEAGAVGLYKRTDGGFTDLVVDRLADGFLSR